MPNNAPANRLSNNRIKDMRLDRCQEFPDRDSSRSRDM